ncbi:MAG: phosphate transport system substrate-binding protein, partial [Pyrinomonadaceae bacterium]|nr:phosphate transport system substrate-binding protein [Pyrinomonadaceae bacterium]
MFPTPQTTRRGSRAVYAVLLAVALATITACSGERADNTATPGAGAGGETIRLQGAGATFPNPLFQKWLSELGKLNPQVRIDYQSIGSGGGIQQIQSQTVDFGAS